MSDQSSHSLPPWEGPAILLVDLDAFFASVEQHDHPAWRGKPVIVGGDADRHGVVSTCSYEARAFGVRSAMPASRARALCPDAIWTSSHFGRYREMSQQVMDILRDETPFVQQVSIDEAFMDVTPNRINTTHPVVIARRIMDRVEALGVTCSIGVGTSKSVAKIASDMDKPRGLTVVYPGGETHFLDPLPSKTLSGVGPAAEKALAALGVHTLGQLRQTSLPLLHRVFGKNAEMMRDRAAGRDSSVVVDNDEVKSVSNEVTFAEDLTERDAITTALASIATKVARRLRQKGLSGKTLTLKVRYADRSIHTCQQPLQGPGDDDGVLRRQLDTMIDELWHPGIALRLLGVGVSGFSADVSSPIQESLFALDDTSDVTNPQEAETTQRSRRSLLTATDALKERFGEDAIQFGYELKVSDNTTGTSSKNPSDYK